MARYCETDNFQDLITETKMNRAEMEICGQNKNRRCLRCYARNCKHVVVGNR